ncbi:MAG: ABC transporter transmembrane domain-containing protein, partial [Chloroflexota bacterium]
MYFDFRLWSLTKGVRLRIALAVLFGLATAAAGVARLALLGWLIGEVIDGREIAELAVPVAGLAGVVAVRGVLQFFKEDVAHQTAALVQVNIRSRLHDKAVELGPAYFGEERTGDAIISLVDGVEQLETFFGQYLPQFFVALLTPIGLFLFMMFLDLPTAGVLLGFALAILLLPSAFHRWNRASSERRRRVYGEFGADFLDSIQGLGTLKAFGQSVARGRLLAERAREVFRSTMWVLATNALSQGFTYGLIATGAATALGLGAYRVNNGDMQLSVLLVILMLGVEVFRPLRELSQLYHQGMLGVSAASGIFRMLDAKPLISDNPGAKRPARIEPTVEFKDVWFSYPGGRAPAHRGLAFRVDKGERVG